MACIGTTKHFKNMRREWRGNPPGTKQLMTQQFLIAHALIKMQQEIYTAFYRTDDRCCIRETSRYWWNTLIAIYLHFPFSPRKGQWLCLQNERKKNERVTVLTVNPRTKDIWRIVVISPCICNSYATVSLPCWQWMEASSHIHTPAVFLMENST